MKHIKWIAHIWKERKWLVVLLFFLTLLSSAVAVLYPYVFMRLIDLLSKILEKPDSVANPYAEIHKIIMLLLAVGISGFIASFFPGIRGATNVVFEYLIRQKYFAKILGKDHLFFQKFKTGDLVTRLTSDITEFSSVSWFLCSGIFRAVESLSKLLFCLTAMFLIHPKLTLLSIIPLPIMIAIFYFTEDKIYNTFRKNQEAISDINNQLEMSFSGVRVIKAFVCEKKYRRFFDASLDRRFTTEMNVIKLDTILMLIYQYIDYFAQMGVIFFGGYMVIQNDISIGVFYAFYNYLGMLIFPILDIPQLFISGKRAFVNIDRLEEIDHTSPEIVSTNKIPVHTIESIRFHNVTFFHEGRTTPIVENLSFEVKRGEKVVVVGPVGAGKSTLLGLLTGYLPPHSGTIEINGIPLEKCDLTSFREAIGYVPQDPILFSGTLRENIAFGKDNIDTEDFTTAVGIAQMKNEIDAFSQKEETRVGQRGVSVSGGQKQRLAIARALVRKPQLLLLDDITASLDAENEARLWNDINTNFDEITCFTVSHRLSTIQFGDTVLYIDNGTLVGHGTHTEMLKNKEYETFIAAHFNHAHGV